MHLNYLITSMSLFWLLFGFAYAYYAMKSLLFIYFFILCYFNRQFLLKVEEKFPKDAELIVACQKGLR